MTCGMGGIGKSLLVVQVVEDLLNDPNEKNPFDLICWITIGCSPSTENSSSWQRSRIRDSLNEMIKSLGISSKQIKRNLLI